MMRFERVAAGSLKLRHARRMKRRHAGSMRASTPQPNHPSTYLKKQRMTKQEVGVNDPYKRRALLLHLGDVLETVFYVSQCANDYASIGAALPGNDALAEFTWLAFIDENMTPRELIRHTSGAFSCGRKPCSMRSLIAKCSPTRSDTISSMTTRRAGAPTWQSVGKTFRGSASISTMRRKVVHPCTSPMKRRIRTRARDIRAGRAR